MAWTSICTLILLDSLSTTISSRNGGKWCWTSICTLRLLDRLYKPVSSSAGLALEKTKNYRIQTIPSELVQLSAVARSGLVQRVGSVRRCEQFLRRCLSVPDTAELPSVHSFHPPHASPTHF